MTFFAILGLPRSRTAWLSRLLSQGEVVCLHEPSIAFRSLEDLDSLLGMPDTGAADSMLTLLWQEILERRPDARLAAVRRSQDEVIASIARYGFDRPENRFVISRIAAALDAVENHPGTLRIAYEDLATLDGCRAVYRHCLDRELDPAWWRYWAPIRVECDPGHQLAEAQRNRVGLLNTFGPKLLL